MVCTQRELSLGTVAAVRNDEQSEWERIAQGLKRRDPELFNELIGRFGGRLMRYLRALIGRADFAEDVWQETWMRVIERGHLYDAQGGRFDTWLYAVARNRSLDFFRRRSHLSLESLLHPEDDSAPLELAAGDPSPLEHLRRRERGDAIVRALGRLNPIHREVLVLHFFDELTMREIAAITGIRMATVKSRLYRAVAFFQAVLKDGLEQTALYAELAAFSM